tara:strand:- start:324 stop:1631 length:1308 start_codon:yes stop_codon:yes gene_type:complete
MPLTQVSSRLIEDTLRYVLGASGTNHYTFTGKGLTGAVNDPTLTLSRGHTYIFENRSGGHPFYIKTSIANGGTNDAYNTGVTNNGGGNGTEIVFTVPHDAPDTLYYQCSSHSSMAGQLSISGSVADGSITTAKLAADAVDGTKIADDAINSEHLVADSIDTEHYAAGSVDTTAIADDAVTADKLANSINTEIAANTAKTSNATHTGEVTGATALTIADDVVDEANLKVSNTPTNGYFLSAQSGNAGGLTWAAAGGGLDGVTTGSGNVTITNGNLIIGTLGKGIDFSATSNASQTGASMSNELLDDYEEGTWTPVILKYANIGGWGWHPATMTSSGTVNQAKYTRIGNVVHLFLAWSGWQQQDSNYAALTGIPFTSIGGGFGNLTYTDAFTSTDELGPSTGNNGTNIDFYKHNHSWMQFSTSSGRYLNFGVTYFCA